MDKLGVALEANLDQLNSGISAAISKVQGFGKAVEGLPAPKLPAPQLASSEIDKVLDSLNAKLRVAQGNVEIFGNQFQGDRLKIVAYQQALNQLLAQGINPTSKEVLNLANNIELLGKKTERQQAILDRQAGRAAAAFKPQEGILQNLQRNIDEYRVKMLRATDTKSIENYRQTIQNLEVQVKRLNSSGTQSLNQVSNATNKLAGSSGQVSIEFARLIQDAPYAANSFGAIANNVQQLTSNFGQLRNQTGSTSKALTASLSSIFTGMGAVNLAISALTAGFVFYQMWQQKSAKSTAETANELRKSKDSIDDYIKSLDSLTQARVNGDRNAQQELTTLRLLYKQTQNTTASTKERQKAVDELQKQFPAYFGNLKDEDILAGKAASAYDRLSTSILATARARAAQSLIAEKAQQQLVNEQKIVDLKNQQAKQEAEAARRAAAAANTPINGGTASGGAIAGQVDRDRIKQAKILNGIIGERQKLELENIALGEQMLALEATATQDLSKGTGSGSSAITKTATESRNALKELEAGFNQATKEAIVFGSSFDEMGVKAGLFKTAITTLMEQGLKPNNAVIQSLKSSYDLFAGTTLPKATSAIERFVNASNPTDLAATAAAIKVIGVEVSKIPANVDIAKESFQGMIDMGGMITNALTSSFALLGETIGNMLTGKADAFSGFFDGILLVVADFAQTFGGALIAAGVASKAFQALITNPFLAIAAGGALIAAAGVVKGVMAKGPQGMSGGGSPSVSTTGGGFRTPTTGTTYNGPSEVIFEIHGETLRGVLDRNAYKRNRIGG